MGSGPVVIRPVNVLLSQPDIVSKGVAHSHTDETWETNEKLVRYESSPESIVSYGDDNTFSPIDDGQHHRSRSRLDACTPYSLTCPEQSISTMLPVQLNTLEEHLITTSLQDYFTDCFGLSTELRPHPSATIVSLSSNNLAFLHACIGLSAQYQLSWNKCQSPQQRYELEYTTMKHKGEAMRLIRSFGSQTTLASQTEDLIASIVGLGMLDRQANDLDTMSLHFNASKHLLKSIGGPLRLQNLWLSRLLVHSECSFGTHTHSFVWDRADFATLHVDLNGFLNKIWSFRNPSASKQSLSRRSSWVASAPSSPQECGSALALRTDSILHDCLSRGPENPTNPSRHDHVEIVSQITCLLMLCSVLFDYQANQHDFQAYLDSTHHLIHVSRLYNQPINNIVWLLLIHDHSDMHSSRIWTTAGWTWVLRHVNYNVQTMVKNWLLAILTGKHVSRSLKLDSFAFSYAS